MESYSWDGLWSGVGKKAYSPGAELEKTQFFTQGKGLISIYFKSLFHLSVQCSDFFLQMDIGLFQGEHKNHFQTPAVDNMAWWTFLRPTAPLHFPWLLNTLVVITAATYFKPRDINVCLCWLAGCCKTTLPANQTHTPLFLLGVTGYIFSAIAGTDCHQSRLGFPVHLQSIHMLVKGQSNSVSLW